MNNPNPFPEMIQRWINDPALMIQEMWGVVPDSWQLDVLAAYARGDRRISIRSAHGVGKTAVVAWITIHHILCKFPQKTAVTAPSSAQAFDAYFAEVKHWIKLMPVGFQQLFNAKADRIELKAGPQSSFVSVRTARPDQPEALQGVHSKHVLLIADEASGVPDPVFEAAAGSMSGKEACTILIGNPVRTSGLFFDTHTRLSDTWTTFHVSALDTDRVSDEFIQEMALRYGVDSNAYRIRVLGEFPITDDDTVIPYGLVVSARGRDLELDPAAPEVWGLDVARFGDDRSVLVRRKGAYVKPAPQVWKGLDLMELSARVKHEWDESADADRPRAIYVDVIGLGSGVVDRLRQIGLPVFAVNVSESPAMKERFRNLRAELWWNTREWLQSRNAKLPSDALFDELSVPRYTFSSTGKIQVEAKAEIKKRGLPSPDVADALIMTFAGDGAIMSYGMLAGHDASEPLRRNVKGIV